MSAPVQNFDIICLQMMNHREDLDSDMKREVTKLVKEVTIFLKSGNSKKVKSQLVEMLPTVFNFRLKAIKWLMKDRDFDLSISIEKIVPEFEELANNTVYASLAESILFALRCNKRVLAALTTNIEQSGQNLANNLAELPPITYQQLLSSFAYVADENAQNWLDFVNNSLLFELIILTTAIIEDSQDINVTKKFITELSSIVAESAQEYVAIAYELGILKRNHISGFDSNEVFDKEFIKEQNQLADFGLQDFAENYY